MKRIILIAAVTLVVAGCSYDAAAVRITPAPPVTATREPGTAGPSGSARPSRSSALPSDGPVTYASGDVIKVTHDGAPWATILVGKVKIVARYKSGSGYFDDVPAKGNVYLQAYVTYTALTDGVSYNPYDWQVFAGGTAVDNSAFVSYGPSPDLGSGTLPKGREAVGWVVYEVPKAGEVVMSYSGSLFDPAPVFEVVVRKP